MESILRVNKDRETRSTADVRTTAGALAQIHRSASFSTFAVAGFRGVMALSATGAMVGTANYKLWPPNLDSTRIGTKGTSTVNIDKTERHRVE